MAKGSVPALVLGTFQIEILSPKRADELSAVRGDEDPETCPGELGLVISGSLFPLAYLPLPVGQS